MLRTSNRMRKMIVFTLAAAMIFTMFSVVQAASGIQLIVNDERLEPDVPPQMIDNRVMVPIRWVSEALGIEVNWDGKNQRVIVGDMSNADIPEKNESASIELVVNGKVLQPDVPPKMMNNRVMVPVRWVSEALGADVTWDGAAETVVINTEEAVKGVHIPNRYEDPVFIPDDELFIFVRAGNQFELPGVFDKVIGNKLKEAFPDLNIRLEIWDVPIRTTDLVDVGVAPDIYITGSKDGIAIELERFGWEMDMTEFIEQSEIDLSTLNQAAVELVKSRSNSQLYGVPIWINERVLYYNKDIFDKFGQEYPVNGMTYDEIFELTQKVMGQAGVQTFKGLAQHPDQYLSDNQLGLLPFEPMNTNEPSLEDIKASVNITTDDWLRLTENMHRFLSLPGNNFVTTDDFFRKGNYAMAVDNINKIPPFFFEPGYMKEKDIHFYEEWSQNVKNIGVVSVPILSKEENWTYQPSVVSAHLTKQSNKKDQAMKVIEWLVSEEAQLQLSRNLYKAVVETDEIVEQFGMDLPNVHENVDGMSEAVYWGENAYVQNYENTKWPDERFPLWFVFRQNVLQNGDSAELALINAQERDIPNWYGWLPREEWE